MTVLPDTAFSPGRLLLVLTTLQASAWLTEAQSAAACPVLVRDASAASRTKADDIEQVMQRFNS